jgi:hypothetical protein
MSTLLQFPSVARPRPVQPQDEIAALAACVQELMDGELAAYWASQAAGSPDTHALAAARAYRNVLALIEFDTGVSA